MQKKNLAEKNSEKNSKRKPENFDQDFLASDLLLNGEKKKSRAEKMKPEDENLHEILFEDFFG